MREHPAKFTLLNQIMEVKMSGENHPNWKGGIRDYSQTFRKKLRNLIKERDNWTCQACGLKTKNTYKLCVHHIDEDIKNDNLDNLVTLCRSCHTRLHRSNTVKVVFN